MSDRTARARIRDAAIQLVADEGPAALTARAVADQAGVSPGLIAHHFGSMDGLFTACDNHVAEAVRNSKEESLDNVATLDPLTSLRSAEVRTLLPYLAHRLTSDSPTVDRLIDQLIEDAVTYTEHGVRSGAFTPTQDPQARAALLILQALGTLVLRRHLARHLDVDLAAMHHAGEPAIRRYVAATADVYGGLLGPETLAALTAMQGEQK